MYSNANVWMQTFDCCCTCSMSMSHTHTRNAHKAARDTYVWFQLSYRMPFSVLGRAANFRPCKMPTLLNKVVESAESPAKSEDYIKVNGLRLVRRPPLDSSGACKMHEKALFGYR